MRRELVLIALVARWHRKGDPNPSQLGDLERKGDGKRLLLLCGVIRVAEQLERSRDGSIAAVDVDDREPCVILGPVADGGPRSDASVAIWSAQRNTDLLADAIGKPVEVVGRDR